MRHFTYSVFLLSVLLFPFAVAQDKLLPLERQELRDLEQALDQHLDFYQLRAYDARAWLDAIAAGEPVRFE